MASLRILILIALGLSLDTSGVQAIDGGYSDWSECSGCTLSCGGGTQTLIRTCTNPPPSDGGKNCSELGPAYKVVPCNEQECPVDGGFTDWSISECSVTCGRGTQKLTRTCTNPPPSNGGKDCSELGPAKKTVSCNKQKCPVDGGYSDWVECTNCSKPCEGGTQILTRTCTNPPPSNGGKTCCGLGPFVTEAMCNEHDCPPPCKPALDVALILDKSSSIKLSHLQLAVNFLVDLVAKFNPAPHGDHFGFIRFNRRAELGFDFAVPQYHDKDALLQKIGNEPIQIGRGTGTHLALGLACDELFTVDGGDRPDAPNVLLLLTDGRPNNFNKTREEANRLHAKGVYLVALGIGKRLDLDTLRQIVGKSNPAIHVDDFDQLEGMIDMIKSKTCSDSKALPDSMAKDEKKLIGGSIPASEFGMWT